MSKAELDPTEYNDSKIDWKRLVWHARMVAREAFPPPRDEGWLLDSRHWTESRRRETLLTQRYEYWLAPDGSLYVYKTEVFEDWSSRYRLSESTPDIREFNETDVTLFDFAQGYGHLGEFDNTARGDLQQSIKGRGLVLKLDEILDDARRKGHSGPEQNRENQTGEKSLGGQSSVEFLLAGDGNFPRFPAGGPDSHGIVRETLASPHPMGGYDEVSTGDGITRYKRNGELHRADGPAEVCPSLNGEFWYLDGKLHRSDGPAVTYWIFSEKRQDREAAVSSKPIRVRRYFLHGQPCDATMQRAAGPYGPIYFAYR